MKKVVAMVIAVIFVMGLASFGFAAGLEKCDKCRKTEEAVDNMNLRSLYPVYAMMA